MTRNTAMQYYHYTTSDTTTLHNTLPAILVLHIILHFLCTTTLRTIPHCITPLHYTLCSQRCYISHHFTAFNVTSNRTISTLHYDIEDMSHTVLHIALHTTHSITPQNYINRIIYHCTTPSHITPHHTVPHYTTFHSTLHTIVNNR